MHLSRVQIKNFRNFANLDVVLGKNIVLVGENRVGKSNFIFALRLVLDLSLPDSARQLKLSDVWDGGAALPATVGAEDQNGGMVREDACGGSSPIIEIHLDFAEFDADAGLTALLTDYRLAENHSIARLSFVFRKKDDVEGEATSEADFEFKIFGGGDEARAVSSQVRRRICLDVLPALRNAEGDLASWRTSPLRPLLEDAISRVPRDALDAVATTINAATANIATLEPISELETNLRTQTQALAGARQDIKAKLSVTPTDPHQLFRAIRLFIDDGLRSIGDASLGSANLALLALKLTEFAWRRQKNERNFTLVAVEEPEAHLHPHLQRKVFGALFNDGEAEGRSLIFSTHSPNIASIAPLRSIVLLKDEGFSGTKAYSLAQLPLKSDELEDLQRYLDVTRADALFSRRIIFVEGDAEAALIPIFAKSLLYDLDELGITVCSVAGTNFKPYARFAAALSLPFAVITDWDPRMDKKKAYGWTRSLDLITSIRDMNGTPLPKPTLDQLRTNEKQLRKEAERHGVFLNARTLETEIAHTPGLLSPLLDVLAEQDFGSTLKDRIKRWKSQAEAIDEDELMLMIGYVSKGRFANQLADALKDLPPPDYIVRAIRHVVEA